MSEAFVIIDIAESHNWQSRFGDSHAIPERKRPTILNLSRADVEREAERLANDHPLGQFCIFEATQVSVQVVAPTHVNINGDVLQTTKIVRLAAVGEEVPF